MFARSNEFEREWIELFYVPSLLFWQPPRFQRSLQCLAQRSRFHLFQPNNQYLGTKVGASLPERRPHNLVLQRLSTLGYGLPFGHAPQQLVDREYARRVFVNMVGVVRGQSFRVILSDNHLVDLCCSHIYQSFQRSIRNPNSREGSEILP